MDWQEYIQIPFQDDAWIKKMLIGSLICLVPIANLLLLGYAIACMDMGMRGRRALPEWNNWDDYLRDALAALAILLAYLLIPIILILALAGIPLMGTVLGAIICLLAGAMIPMALAAYTFCRQPADAFRFTDLLKRIGAKLDSYIFAYLFIVLALTIGLAIMVSLPYLAFVGALLIFYATVVFSYLVGHISQAV